MLNRQGRPTRADGDMEAEMPGHDSFSGHRGLEQDEPLLFEVGAPDRSGVDLPDIPDHKDRLGALRRTKPMGLAGLSEPEAVRHYVRLSQKNYSIDTGLYPLGSCTMKHNPRLNEKTARLPGFADIHPLQPETTIQGALEVIDQLADWLKKLTGMPAVAMSPRAGAHGELCGLMAIRAALDDAGNGRSVVLVPESAHGTNPATAVQCGYTVKSIPCDDHGRVNYEAFLSHLNEDVAAIMITNPNTCGVFEKDIVKISKAIHDIGGYVYCDGANFNAIVGKVRPGDLGVDAMHINLHKTFSTPHGGGGPGSGPVVLSEALQRYAPYPLIIHDDKGFHLVEDEERVGAAQPFGRIGAFHGQMGMFTRALTYILSHGYDGLRQLAEDAVLNANYILAKLKDDLSPAFSGTCMHEALFDESFLKGTGITTLDFAKAMIDEGYHPMTMYFPLVVHGAMLIEPTESESKQSLDRFIDTLAHMAQSAKAGETARFKSAPHHAPRARLDETRAARSPVLRWHNDKIAE